MRIFMLSAILLTLAACSSDNAVAPKPTCIALATTPADSVFCFVKKKSS